MTAEVMRGCRRRHDRSSDGRDAREPASGERYKTRWRNIRDAYVKWLRKKKLAERSGSGGGRRQKDYQFAKQLSFINASLEPRLTEDNLEQEEPTQEARFSSEESLVDDDVADVTYCPEARSRRRESLITTPSFDDDLAEESLDVEVAGPSVEEAEPPQSTAMEAPGEQEQSEEHRETAAQPARRATPTQARGQKMLPHHQ
ncbi:uncharacterized protein [Hyperolius riggenbachi]|uniref:uncharacterized protein n=1 Tax=Hyperolius riggenbachi TaxID=752182 RepID=UPI0035A2962B